MILFVCEGNVCRSPLAAALLSRAFGEAGIGLAVGSAGTRALVGRPVDESTAALAERAGLDLSEHRARRLDRDLAGSAQLLLAATRRVRSQAVAIHPPAVQYAFTIRQLGRLLAGADGPVTEASDPAERVLDVRTYAVRHRGLRVLEDPSVDDIVDPYGRSMEIHTEAAGQLAPAVGELSRALGGPGIDWPR
ncbi:arsenate reductase/protein-tyrosine-phosphatase family protein [Microlunatus ginsengisoli]|uniref:Low molecular weight phosphatase family protein n=1 Tax=Microlunatus ginsengisoli TaxID=363863 RepID=A0ABP6ZK62_9ACTN